MARTKKTVNGGYQILDFNYANITTEGIVVEGGYKTILDAIESNKPLMVKNVILVDTGVDIEDNYANIVKVGTTFILSIGIVGDKTYTLSITDADTTSYQVNDNASQSELNIVEDMVNQLSYNEAVPFDSTQTYTEGQYVIHEGQFYKCIIAVEEAGEFNINNWDTVTIGNELEELVETNKEINQNLSLIGTKYKTQNTITHANAWTVTDIGKLTVPKGIYAVELRVEASEAITATEVEIGIANHAWNAYHLNGTFNYAQSVTAVGEFDGDIIGHIFPAGNLDNINIYVTLEAYRIA